MCVVLSLCKASDSRQQDFDDSGIHAASANDSRPSDVTAVFRPVRAFDPFLYLLVPVPTSRLSLDMSLDVSSGKHVESPRPLHGFSARLPLPFHVLPLSVIVPAPLVNVSD